MHKVFRMFVVIASVVALILSISLTGCTRHPNEKQCQAYEEQVKATASAEEQLQQKKQEKTTVEQQLAEKKQKLEDVKSEKEKVKSKLGGM